jgi:hypothetical protein
MQCEKMLMNLKDEPIWKQKVVGCCKVRFCHGFGLEVLVKKSQYGC